MQRCAENQERVQPSCWEGQWAGLGGLHCEVVFLVRKHATHATTSLHSHAARVWFPVREKFAPTCDRRSSGLLSDFLTEFIFLIHCYSLYSFLIGGQNTESARQNTAQVGQNTEPRDNNTASGGTKHRVESSPQNRTFSWITSFNLGFGKKEPAGNRTTITCGRTKIERCKPLNGGSVSLLCIPSGFDLGTPGFQDNRVCRFHFSLRLEKIGRNSWESGFLPFSLASIGVNGEAPAAETEGNKRKRLQLHAIRQFAGSPFNSSN